MKTISPTITVCGKSLTPYVWNMEILKEDIDAALAQSAIFKAFETRLKDMGYEICRDENFAHYSVKGTGLPVLLNSAHTSVVSSSTVAFMLKRGGSTHCFHPLTVWL